MTQFRHFPVVTSLAEGERKVTDIDGVSLLLIHSEGTTHAMENRCPHRGSPLSGAVLREGCIQCPWHGLRFNVASGDCVTNEKMRLRKFALIETDRGMEIEIALRDEKKAVTAGIQTALVRYGVTGQVGWFGTIDSLSLHRGAQVVVESAMGRHLGEVLIGGDEPRQSTPQKTDLRGEIVRCAAPEDLTNHALAIQQAKAQFGAVNAKVATVGHQLSELEVLLDQEVMVAWLLSAPDASLGPTGVELAEEFSLSQVRFFERPAEDSPAASIRYNGNARRNVEKLGGRSMKGPGLRQKNELDRVWECPGCQHRERSTGIQTSLVCPKCSRNGGSKPPFMKLVSSPPTAPRRTFEVSSNTPTPTPVASILGEDTARIPKKQALRPLPSASAAEASPETVVESTIEGGAVEPTAVEPSAVEISASAPLAEERLNVDSNGNHASDSIPD